MLKRRRGTINLSSSPSPPPSPSSSRSQNGAGSPDKSRSTRSRRNKDKKTVPAAMDSSASRSPSRPSSPTSPLPAASAAGKKADKKSESATTAARESRTGLRPKRPKIILSFSSPSSSSSRSQSRSRSPSPVRRKSKVKKLLSKGDPDEGSSILKNSKKNNKKSKINGHHRQQQQESSLSVAADLKKNGLTKGEKKPRSSTDKPNSCRSITDFFVKTSTKKNSQPAEAVEPSVEPPEVKVVNGEMTLIVQEPAQPKTTQKAEESQEELSNGDSGEVGFQAAGAGEGAAAVTNGTIREGDNGMDVERVSSNSPPTAAAAAVEEKSKEKSGAKKEVAAGKPKSPPPPPSPKEDSSRRRSSRLAQKSYPSVKNYFISDKPEKTKNEKEEGSDDDESTSEETKKRSSSGKKKKSGTDKRDKPSTVPVVQKPKLDEATREFLYSGLPSPVEKAQKQVEKRQELEQWLDTVQYFPRFSHVLNCEDEEEAVPPPPLSWPATFHLHPAASGEGEEESSGTVHAHAQQALPWLTLTSCLVKTQKAMSGHVEVAGGGLPCCSSKFSQPPTPLLTHLISRFGSNINVDGNDMLPWTEKYRPEAPEQLGIEQPALDRFTNWLSSWKTDINENDGATRRSTATTKSRKRRRGGSDSDFITSDEEDDDYYGGGGGGGEERPDKRSDLRKKSVVLYGPTGSGKTAMVYTMAEHFGFKVVEINFSSRRSGRDVLEQVEEATLSQSVHVGENEAGSASGSENESSGGDSDGDADADTGDGKKNSSRSRGGRSRRNQISSSSEEESESGGEEEEDEDEDEDGKTAGGGGANSQDNRPCLLLFEDIDLYEDEDEGFYRAIVQLISQSCRPIVMTISTSDECRPSIDTKIEKTDPLWIYTHLPSLERLVSKVLLPIAQGQMGALNETYQLGADGNEEDRAYMVSFLAVIALHSGHDIRKAVNQLQFYWSPDWFGNFGALHEDLCGYGILEGFHQLADDPKPEGEAAAAPVDVEEPPPPTKAQLIRNLEGISTSLTFLTDLDFRQTAQAKLAEYGQGSVVGPAQRLICSEAKRIFFVQVHHQVTDVAKGHHQIPPPLYFFTSMLYKPLPRQQALSEILHMNNQLLDYLDADSSSSAAVGVDELSYLRTIVKLGILNSIAERKRNGRIRLYFNRLPLELVELIRKSFDFGRLKVDPSCLYRQEEEEKS